MVAYVKQSLRQSTEQTVPQIEVCRAKAMSPEQRCEVATRVLAGNDSISQAARERQVSRKFVARQKAKAQDALDAAFAPSAEDSEVLFHLPVTKWSVSQITSWLG